MPADLEADLFNDRMLMDDLEQCASKHTMSNAIAAFRMGYGHDRYSVRAVREALIDHFSHLFQSRSRG